MNEYELREYLKTIPYNQRRRTAEYEELKSLIDSRYNKLGACSNCGHNCHAYAGVGERVTGRCHCDCKHCKCNHCELLFGQCEKPRAEYQGIFDFAKAQRKYYEDSTPESRTQMYQPWLSKEKIIKDAVHLLSTALVEETKKNHAKRKLSFFHRVLRLFKIK